MKLKNLNFNYISLTLCLTFVSSFTFAQTKIKSSYHLKSAISSLSKAALMKDLRAVVRAGKPNRFIGTPGHKNTQKFLQDFIKKYGELSVHDFTLPIEAGIKLYENDFNAKVKGKFPETSETYKKWNGFKKYMTYMLKSRSTMKGKNLIWTKKGKSSETMVITAHYDTVSHDKKTFKIDVNSKMPGADYNASGVSIAMNIIKLLSKHDLEKTIKVVFLDAQGLGFLGSYAYAEKLKSSGEDIIGVVNLEMLGHDSKVLDKKKKYANFRVYTQSKKANGYHKDYALIKKFNEYNRKRIYSIKFDHIANNFESSDNFRFWNAGFGSITFSQNWEDDFNTKGYQSSNDFPETINQNTLYKAYGYIGYAVMAYALNLSKY